MFALLVVACAKGPAPVAESTPPAPLAPSLVAPAPIAAAVPVEEPVVQPVTYALRRGETLAHFARWSGLPIEDIAAASGLSVTDDQLPVGTKVTIPLDDEGRARVEAARDAHHARRVEGWLATHGGEAGTEFYTVTTGDTASSIAKDHHDLPVWVVETYNPALDLDRLRPGQQLMLPVTEDVLEDD